MEVRAWSGGIGELVVRGQATKQAVEVGLGVAPVEGNSGLLIAALEAQQASFDLGEIDEVVGGQDLALDDGEVDLDLVEPRRMDGQMDQAQVAPLALQPLDGCLAAVGGAVVDH